MPPSSPMPPSPETALAGTRPLLTVVVPTYNRAADLAELLAVLLPQLAPFPQVELLVVDNASPDSTPEVVAAAREQFRAAGAYFRALRHPENIGSDANFAFCFREARGHFFWMCGDDDRITPGALADVVSHLQTPDGRAAELDMIYATSYGFHRDFLAERQGDPLGRRFHTVRDPRTLAAVVNIMFSFISGMVVNKSRLESLPHEDPEAFVGSNLVQLSWTLPLLLHHRRSVVLWTRPVAARLGNAHGYSVGHVFGERLAANLARLLPGRPDLSQPILNFALRRWFPSVVLDLRGSGNNTMQLEEAHDVLARAYGRNPRYWVFTYPALTLPLSLAKLYTKGTAALSKLIYMLQLPGFWRRQT